MAFQSSASLLSLTGSVDVLLLSYVATGYGGMQSVLNLRKVCSTTKDWVDFLPLRQGRRIFDGTIAEVECSLQGLRDFLSAPPPPHVTSLQLTESEQLPKLISSAEGKQLWTDFNSFWSKKLEYLDMEYLDLSLFVNLEFGSLTASPRLQLLHCDEISSLPAGSPEVTKRLFLVEALTFNSLKMNESELEDFYSQLSNNPNLQRLYVWLCENSDFRLMPKVIKAKKDAPDFFLHATLLNDCEMCPIEDFASSVAASSSLICLFECPSEQLAKVAALEESVAQRFFQKVESISSFDLQAENTPTLVEFPNLKQLECLEGDAEDFEGVVYPPKLYDLGIQFGLPHPSTLPRNLTSLSIEMLHSTPNELLESINLLKEFCPLLQHVKLNWEWKETSDENESPPPPPPMTPPFQHLTRLIFKGSFPVTHPSTVPFVLLEILQIPQLPLNRLRLTMFVTSEPKPDDSEVSEEADTPYPWLDSQILSCFIEGRVAATLENVYIAKGSVAEEAQPLLLTLDSLALANANGRKRFCRVRF